MFDPEWGYYSTGQVRFGEGGHYDTFPIALSPMFGRMVVQYAFRLWRRAGEPRDFEVCELGAGNGQLCLDAIVWLHERARRDRAWRRFAERVRYRIVERSPALIARQRAQLGPLASQVKWTRADLAQRPARGTPFAAHGLVIANEVLDCLAHHQIVRQTDGSPGVVFVIPEVAADAHLEGRGVTLVPGVGGVRNAVAPADLGTVVRDERWYPHLTFREVTLPLQMVPKLHLFLWWYYPEFFAPGHRMKPYFACPGIEPMVQHTARLYRHPVVLWIDYGDGREFHLNAPVSQRAFAGPPRSGASVYDAPGADDITFMVDFSVVGRGGEARRVARRVLRRARGAGPPQRGALQRRHRRHHPAPPHARVATLRRGGRAGARLAADELDVDDGPPRTLARRCAARRRRIHRPLRYRLSIDAAALTRHWPGTAAGPGLKRKI